MNPDRSIGSFPPVLNQLIVESLADAINRVRADKDFTTRAERLLERDREILDRLAK